MLKLEILFEDIDELSDVNIGELLLIKTVNRQTRAITVNLREAYDWAEELFNNGNKAKQKENK